MYLRLHLNSLGTKDDLKVLLSPFFRVIRTQWCITTPIMFLLFSRFISLFYGHEYTVAPVCIWDIPEEGISCEPPCGYWELNSGPLIEQLVFLTTEPSLQPSVVIFYLFIFCFTLLGIEPMALCMLDKPCNNWAMSQLQKVFGESKPPVSVRGWLLLLR